MQLAIQLAMQRRLKIKYIGYTSATKNYSMIIIVIAPALYLMGK